MLRNALKIYVSELAALDTFVSLLQFATIAASQFYPDWKLFWGWQFRRVEGWGEWFGPDWGRHHLKIANEQ